MIAILSAFSQEVCCQPIPAEAATTSLNDTRVSIESEDLFGYFTLDIENKQVAADGYVTIDVPSGETSCMNYCLCPRL
jgi:hypothetical protein